MKDTQVSRILSVYKRNANILITGALIIFLGFLGGCISEIPQEVIVYTSHDQIHSAPILNLFQAKTGIKVKAVYDVEAAKTAGIVNRLIAEKTHPRCDVFWNNENSRTVVLKHKGVLAPYRSTAAASIPDQFKDPDGFWTGFGARARVIIYNTDLIRPDQAPHSIYDFIQPQWRGQFAIANPLFGTTASHAAALFVFLGDAPAKHYFLALQANDVVIAAGNSVVKDMVASGEVKAGLTDTDDVNMALLAGKPVGMIYPDQNAMGTLVIPNTFVAV